MGAIRFPNLGFEVLVGKSFTVFGFEIAFYGLLIALGMILGAAYAYHEAARTGQKVDDYIDYTIFGIIGAIIGARIYYVAFEWDYYSKNLSQIVNIRGGGLAIYGAIIGATLVLLVFSKIKKIRFFQFMDTMVFGLLIGQIIGRWGNFLNREAFGGYTNNIFAMQIPVADLSSLETVSDSMLVTVHNAQYIQVHPTFLYESLLNLVLLIILIIFRDKKKFYGENLCRYAVGYGIIRFFVEGLRTDQLQFKGIAVSQIVSVVIGVIGLAFIIIRRIQLAGKPAAIDPIPPKMPRSRKKKGEEAKAGESPDPDEEEILESEEYANEEDNDAELFDEEAEAVAQESRNAEAESETDVETGIETDGEAGDTGKSVEDTAEDEPEVIIEDLTGEAMPEDKND